ncbi:SsrA-binding protein SmpB [Candidatus Parcubacteria bacterium]|nr:MAG: SsrA-binding protein SmpB [Candidatus Parcubacteria bacterium]
MKKEFATNRKARFDYQILETFEAGLALNGFEVKAIKEGRVDISHAFIIPHGKELFLVNAHLSPSQIQTPPQGYNPTRSRKLLMHKKEIAKLIGLMRQGGLTLIPLSFYNKHGLVKLELALAKGKKKSDKREAIRKRETQREIKRTLKI